MSNDESASTVTPSTSPLAESEDHLRRPRWSVAAVIALGALLLGVGTGLVIGSSARSDGADAHTAANSTAIGFSQDMITHHQQAVEMTQVVIERGTDPTVRDLAITMLTDQNKEIGQMTGWLQAWGAPLQNPGAPMSWMGHEVNGGHDHDTTGQHGHGPAAAPTGDQPTMEGMATKAEMTRLRSLSGSAVDTYFLQLMLRHHQGGHHMMTMVIDPTSGAPEYVRSLADQMNKAQTAEEATMKQLLAQRAAQPLP